MTIPAVSSGQTIAATWGNAVADAINPGAWQAAAFTNSWFNYGGAFSNVASRLENDVVRVRGLARKNSAGTAGEDIFRLPSQHWPPAAVLVISLATIGASANVPVRLTVLTTGFVQIQTAPASGANWVSCEFSFSVTA